MEISDRVAVLMKGKCIGSVNTKETNEDQLTEMMVGKKIELNIERSDVVNPKDRLIVSGLNCKMRKVFRFFVMFLSLLEVVRF